ncbi:AAA family ATPase, partial [Listeria monocytogenes]|nr:AAA family ATPase [Listeria monocytogenes]
MMFYGPAGVGKTEAAKIINDSLDQGGILRQQMSMFQTSDFASYLFGGTLEAPSLAKDLMKREGNVILFDEFNRCSPYLYSAFFQ